MYLIYLLRRRVEMQIREKEKESGTNGRRWASKEEWKGREGILLRRQSKRNRILYHVWEYVR
jgi:hypothetical protein